MQSKLLLTAATVAIIGGGLLSTTSAFAQSQVTENGHMSSLAQRIADKFGLNKADVQAVFEEEHQARKAEMKVRFEERLNQLVTNGKITESQKQLIIAKNAELEANRETKMENFKNMTDEERKTAMEAERAALAEWAKNNGIDMQYMMHRVFFKGPGKGGHGPTFDMVHEVAPAE